MKKRIITLLMAMMILGTVLAGCSGEGAAIPEIPSDTSANPAEDTDTTGANDSENPAEPEVPSDRSQTVTIKIPAPSLKENIVDEAVEQGAAIYLPKGYETSGKNYPVMYYLHGFGASYQGAIVTMSNYMDKNDIQDMIIVCINGTNALGGSFYFNSPVTGNWEDFVTKDVISYIDSNYRTIANASGRAIAGHSMGGFGTINAVMHNPGVYDYAYSLSPGVFDEEGFSKSPMDFSVLSNRIEEYSSMSPEEARDDFLGFMNGGGKSAWPTAFSYAYGAAFAYDTEGKAPYVKMPATDEQGNYMEDEVWAMLESGYGNIPAKVEEYGDNLKELKGFTIDYGMSDNYPWIPEGCEYFSELMNERSIPHTLVPYEGTHQSHLNERITKYVIPFFLDGFQNAAE